LFARSDVLVFEDLGEQGFKTLAPNIADLQNLIVTLPQMRMLMRQLAKFHASSLIDVDWVQV